MNISFFAPRFARRRLRLQELRDCGGRRRPRPVRVHNEDMYRLQGEQEEGRRLGLGRHELQGHARKEDVSRKKCHKHHEIFQRQDLRGAEGKGEDRGNLA